MYRFVTRPYFILIIVTKIVTNICGADGKPAGGIK